MRLERKVNLGGFQSMAFASSEHNTMQECAQDLVNQMKPLATIYPTVKQAMDEMMTAYGAV